MKPNQIAITALVVGLLIGGLAAALVMTHNQAASPPPQEPASKEQEQKTLVKSGVRITSITGAEKYLGEMVERGVAFIPISEGRGQERDIDVLNQTRAAVAEKEAEANKFRRQLLDLGYDYAYFAETMGVNVYQKNDYSSEWKYAIGDRHGPLFDTREKAIKAGLAARILTRNPCDVSERGQVRLSGAWAEKCQEIEGGNGSIAWVEIGLAKKNGAVKP